MDYQEAVENFLQYMELEQNRSSKTIGNYRHYLTRLSDYAGEITVNDIDTEMIRKWRMWLTRLGTNSSDELGKQTQNYHLIALRSFLKYCTKQGYKTLASDQIELARTVRKQVNYLNPEEVARLISQPPGDTVSGLRDKAILELLFSSGLRVSELVSLDRSHINLGRKEFSVRGKGQKDRPIFISDQAAEAIKSYTDKRTDNIPALFIRFGGKSPVDLKGNYRRLTARSIQRMVSRYGLLAGITKQVSPHTLRHSFATDLLMNGADMRSVQALLGHSNIATTQIYTHITDPHLKKVHQQFHNKSAV